MSPRVEIVDERGRRRVVELVKRDVGAGGPEDRARLADETARYFREQLPVVRSLGFSAVDFPFVGLRSRGEE